MCSRIFCVSGVGAIVYVLMISTLYANESERDSLGKERGRLWLVVGIGSLFEQHSSGK